jgi:hypothetical protein
MGNRLNHQSENEDFLLKFYKDDPDSIFEIGEWETELGCEACGGAIPKNAHCLFNQKFPTDNIERMNLALEDARCPHCLEAGKIEKISEALSIYTPLPTKEIWFRKLVIDPPTRRIKKLFTYEEVPQDQKYIKEYR